MAPGFIVVLSRLAGDAQRTCVCLRVYVRSDQPGSESIGRGRETAPVLSKSSSAAAYGPVALPACPQQ